MPNSFTFQGIGYPSVLNPNVKKPLDVRLIVNTLDDRNRLQFTYPSMPVTVLGAPVVLNGINTYPNQTYWRCLVDKQPNAVDTAPTTATADWRQEKNPEGARYKGPWAADTNTPDLNGELLRAALVPGDFFKVASVAQGVAVNATVDGNAAYAVNDTVFWNGTRFDRFQNTNPEVLVPLYLASQGAQWGADVARLIRETVLPEWQAQAYLKGSFVKSTYLVGTAEYVDTYQAWSRDLSVGEAALPTELTPNGLWKLISTTNGAKLGGTASNGDTIGKAATGAFKPTTVTPGKYLSVEEVDARIKQYATGSIVSPLLGGNASTWLTADQNEVNNN